MGLDPCYWRKNSSSECAYIESNAHFQLMGNEACSPQKLSEHLGVPEKRNEHEISFPPELSAVWIAVMKILSPQPTLQLVVDAAMCSYVAAWPLSPLEFHPRRERPGYSRWVFACLQRSLLRERPGSNRWGRSREIVWLQQHPRRGKPGCKWWGIAWPQITHSTANLSLVRVLIRCSLASSSCAVSESGLCCKLMCHCLTVWTTRLALSFTLHFLNLSSLCSAVSEWRSAPLSCLSWSYLLHGLWVKRYFDHS